MSDEELTTERRIMILMRKTLAKVIRDTTPEHPGLKRGISDETVEDIRLCLSMIAAREQELAQALGIEVKERPRYADEPRRSNVVSITNLKKSLRDGGDKPQDGE